jgi:four helix bundle protein
LIIREEPGEKGFEREDEWEIDVRTYFDHEKLDVYHLELRFITWVTALLATIKQRPTNARITEVLDQLDRASLSALLNTAEGNGRHQRRTRAKFFDDARGSATECAACLDALVAKGVCTGGEIDEGKQLLLRIASMLTKLIERFDVSSSSPSASPLIQEEPDEEGFEDEEENEDEH